MFTNYQQVDEDPSYGFGDNFDVVMNLNPNCAKANYPFMKPSLCMRNIQRPFDLEDMCSPSTNVSPMLCTNIISPVALNGFKSFQDHFLQDDESS